MADSSKDIPLRELKDMINVLRKMIKTLQATIDAANKREAALVRERDNLKEEADLLRKKLFGSFSGVNSQWQIKHHCRCCINRDAARKRSRICGFSAVVKTADRR